MPVDYKKYPARWHELSRALRFGRAAGRCECAGECGRNHERRCGARHNQWAVYQNRQFIRYDEYDEYDEAQPEGTRYARIVLTVAHLWRGPCRPCFEQGLLCANPDHLKALCQSCHTRYDGPLRAGRVRATRARRARQPYLPGCHPL